MGEVIRLSQEKGKAQLRVTSVIQGDETWKDRLLKLTGVGGRECDGLLELGDRWIFYTAGDGNQFSLQGFSTVENVQGQGNLQRGRSQFMILLKLRLLSPCSMVSPTTAFCDNDYVLW